MPYMMGIQVQTAEELNYIIDEYLNEDVLVVSLDQYEKVKVKPKQSWYSRESTNLNIPKQTLSSDKNKKVHSELSQPVPA